MPLPSVYLGEACKCYYLTAGEVGKLLAAHADPPKLGENQALECSSRWRKHAALLTILRCGGSFEAADETSNENH